MLGHRTPRLWRRVATILLALALLVAWQSALQHPVEHVDELGRFVHLHDEPSDGEHSGSGALCDALAALTACAASKHGLLATLQSHYDSPSCPSPAPRVADAPPFLAQGPPASV